PLPNYRVYILDRQNRPQPVGIPGELCIGGVGLANGYLNNPTLTHEKFRQNPFIKDGRVYMTGDLARWLADGNIEFYGRIDNQVKIRGYRIELGEIENRLAKHDAVDKAVVLVRTDDREDKFICAYIIPVHGELVSQSHVSPSGLREYLAESLPDYMMPQYFMMVENIPLTPNGKIDYKALPAPGIQSSDGYIVPGTPLQIQLVKLWSDVLKIEESVIGIDTNYFELGGHSLNATILIAKIHKELDAKISFNEIFKSPTIRKLSKWIQTAEETPYMQIPAVAEAEYYDASHAQKRVWTLSRIDQTASIAFNIPTAHLLQGKLHIPAVEQTFRTLVERHETLRTVFIAIDMEVKQKILKPGEAYLNLDCVDLREDSDKKVKVGEYVKRQSTTPFDLARGPLLNVMLIRLEEESVVFFINMHHIISDFVSHKVFLEEMLTLYTATVNNQPSPLKPLRIHYKDYA
ncbi:MAG: AMP-binding protein, partial [bacterium]|nr:AMP-binding protein [bacterium]